MKPVIYNITHMFIIMVYLLITTDQAHSQWATNPAINNGISKAAYQQQYPNIVSDGSGGAIITWEDFRNGANYDIYARRINSLGVAQWTANGVAICDVVNNQTSPQIISDGAGGAIIAWEDNYSGTRDIYAQKINASGIVQWTQNGVAISTAWNNQDTPAIVSDGSGGAIITWVDNRSGVFPDMSINVQRINASGVVQWVSNGIPICTGIFSKSNPVIIGDDSGGAIIAWQDYRVGGISNIYAQKINASGIVQWDSNGVVLCPTTFAQYDPAIVSNGAGGAIIAWQDYRTTTNWGIYAQMIHSSGIISWDYEGIEICDVVNHQMAPQLISCGSGGAIITWNDYRSGLSDIYAQKLNSSGTAQWTLDGVALCTESSTEYNPTIAGDGAGGAIITWGDYRSGTSADIYAQKINASGIVQWTQNGVAISTAWNNQNTPAIVSDGSAGAIITWEDSRSGSSYDIYAQKIDKYGLLGQAAPKLVAAKDIANDQGGRVRLFWDPSYLDADTGLTVKSYTVKLGAKTKGIIGKTTGTTGNGIYWQTSDIVRADQSEGYSSVVATYADSGLQGIPMYYFQVIAKNSDSTQSWYSNIDSGYSVDNIPPVGVGGATLMANTYGGIKLQWNKNSVDKDLMGYVIYRDTVSGVTMNKTKKLTQIIDTIFVDTLTTYGKTYYYKIAAIDIHGNVGEPSKELYQTVLTVRTIRGVAPKIFALEQNYPNPFNPTTTIEFTVPSNGHAMLKIFNAIGQEVATLFNGEAEAGKYHQVQFNANGFATGLYLSRLEFDGKVQLKKMMLVK